MRRTQAAALVLGAALVVSSAAPVLAVTIKHETSSFDATIPWSCPGPNPIEHYT